MLTDHISLNAVLELAAEDIAGYCDDLDGKAFISEIEDYYQLGRKDLCRYLGIGESTLSGWLKEDRVPQMARVALLLRLAMNLLKEEIDRLQREAKDLKILKNGDVYQVCVFQEDEDGLVVGRVIADGIQDLGHARLLSVSIKAQNMLQRAKGVINNELESLGEYGQKYTRELLEIQKEITEQYYFVFNYDEFKKYYGKNRHSIQPLDLDALAERIGLSKSEEPAKNGNGDA